MLKYLSIRPPDNHSNLRANYKDIAQIILFILMFALTIARAQSAVYCQ